MEVLIEEAPPRKITWYTDIDGGKGKTEFAKWYTMVNNHDSVYLTPGPKADMLYAI